MPFINDRLDATHREEADKAAMSAENALAGPSPTRTAQDRVEGSRFSFSVDAIDRHLGEEIIGQDAARTRIREILDLALADIGDPRRPIGTLLFLGPTGVGKTEIVRALARAMHADADMLCRIDMNTLSQEHYAASLTGAPPGYVGAKEGGTVFDQDKIEGARGRPGIVLFDEMEKASHEVILALLNILDNGMMTVASGGRTYSFRKAIIFMTSNLATEELFGAQRGGPIARLRDLASGRAFKSAETIAEDALLARFPPEFVNRLDIVHVFDALGRSQIRELVEIEVRRINRRLERRNLGLSCSEDLMRHLVSAGFDEKFGARDLKRRLRATVEVPLARHIATSGHGPDTSGSPRRLTAGLEDGTPVILETDADAGPQPEE